MKLTDDAKELVAEMALDYAKKIFSRDGEEAKFQDWKRKRKEKADEVSSLRTLWDAS